eukprot:10763533-Karenia_brevis.AAC.1
MQAQALSDISMTSYMDFTTAGRTSSVLFDKKYVNDGDDDDYDGGRAEGSNPQEFANTMMTFATVGPEHDS